ncbi:MAG: AI-2E family transporter [Rhodospirillales bacterium]|nr:MAG: AI-2E family transporter [Rhodospirillales bacterium]
MAVPPAVTPGLAAAPGDDQPRELPPEVQERLAEMPVPQDIQTFLLTGIFLLLTLFALYFTGEVVLPIIFAFILYLVLQPAMRAFARLRFPKALAALALILALFGGVGALGFTLSGPTADWVAKAPESLRRIESRLFALKQPIADLQRVGKQVETITEGPPKDGAPVRVAGPGIDSLLFSGTRSMAVGLGTTVVLLFFLLASGDLFLRRLVEILPAYSDKKQAVEISREIEANISSYLATISLMNLGVGVLTGVAAYATGLSDPILWGTLAFLLNFIPIIGPLAGAFILLVAGLLSFDDLWRALLPVGVYLAIHLVEGQFVTPMLLARRFILNPVLIMVAIVFWYWMWGIAGALLAVPLLATVKIVCDRIRPLMAFGHFLGGEARD